jgi:large subunit ribosomal protein L17
MRHQKQGLKLGRTSSHRSAMFRNMVTSLLKHDRIRTTDVKAKEIRRWADHVITLAKRGDLHARRQALAIVMEKNVVHKLFEEANERFAATTGGYTRVLKMGRRPGDAAPMSVVELVAAQPTQKSKKKAASEPDKPETQTAAPAKESAAEAPAAESSAQPEEAEAQTDAASDTPEETE